MIAGYAADLRCRYQAMWIVQSAARDEAFRSDVLTGRAKVFFRQTSKT